MTQSEMEWAQKLWNNSAKDKFQQRRMAELLDVPMYVVEKMFKVEPKPKPKPKVRREYVVLTQKMRDKFEERRTEKGVSSWFMRKYVTGSYGRVINGGRRASTNTLQAIAEFLEVDLNEIVQK